MSLCYARLWLACRLDSGHGRLLLLLLLRLRTYTRGDAREANTSVPSEARAHHAATASPASRGSRAPSWTSLHTHTVLSGATKAALRHAMQARGVSGPFRHVFNSHHAPTYSFRGWGRYPGSRPRRGASPQAERGRAERGARRSGPSPTPPTRRGAPSRKTRAAMMSSMFCGRVRAHGSNASAAAAADLVDGRADFLRSERRRQPDSPVLSLRLPHQVPSWL
jgi:hypothetical protein